MITGIKKKDLKSLFFEPQRHEGSKRHKVFLVILRVFQPLWFSLFKNSGIVFSQIAQKSTDEENLFSLNLSGFLNHEGIKAQSDTRYFL